MLELGQVLACESLKGAVPDECPGEIDGEMTSAKREAKGNRCGPGRFALAT